MYTCYLEEFFLTGILIFIQKFFIQRNWLSLIPVETQYGIKRKLMERALAWVDCYKSLDLEMKKSYPLFRGGMCTAIYWKSIKDAEDALEVEHVAIRKEAEMVQTLLKKPRWYKLYS